MCTNRALFTALGLALALRAGLECIVHATMHFNDADAKQRAGQHFSATASGMYMYILNGHTMLFERYCGCNSVHVGHVRPCIALDPP